MKKAKSRVRSYGRSALYDWLSAEDDVAALSNIVSSDAWEEYTKSPRYKAKGRPAFHQQRAAFQEWLMSCADENHDVFFSAQSLE